MARYLSLQVYYCKLYDMSKTHNVIRNNVINKNCKRFTCVKMHPVRLLLHAFCYATFAGLTSRVCYIQERLRETSHVHSNTNYSIHTRDDTLHTVYITNITLYIVKSIS